MNKINALTNAIEIAKEAMRGGNQSYPGTLIQDAFDKIIEISEANQL
jgi:hypothetical protein